MCVDLSWCVCVGVVSVSVFVFCVQGDVVCAMSHIAADTRRCCSHTEGKRVCTIPASLLRPPRAVTERGPELDFISPGRVPPGKPTHNLSQARNPEG